MPRKAACSTRNFRLGASPTDTERPNNERVPDAVTSTNRTRHNPPASSRSAPARTWWKFACAGILCIATAGQIQSATAEECAGQILKVVGKEDIPMTILQDSTGALKNEPIKENGKTMKMPLCVLHFDKMERVYRIRLSDGAEASLIRKYVLESTDKPFITIKCDGYTIYKTKPEGGTRGIGPDPCG